MPFWLLLALLIALPAVSWAISLDDVIELSQAGHSDEQITHLIEVTQSRFQVDTDAIINLKEAGVSDTVILAVIGASQTRSPSSSRPAEPGESGTIDSFEGDDTDIEYADTVPNTEWAEQSGYSRHEIALGLGGGMTFEDNAFNIPDGVKASPELGINMGYLYNFDRRFAVGAHIYGYIQTITDIEVVDEAGDVLTDKIELNVSNLGVRGRWLFTDGRVQPYGLLVANYATGILKNDVLGNLYFHGVSGGGGLGALVKLGTHTALSVEGVAAFGFADWTERPFRNSAGTDFDPSMIGFFLNIVHRWGLQ